MHRLKAKIIRRYRVVTSRARVLPNFLIIGAQKAGTTSLHDYLAQHPNVQPAYKKEPHYFTHHFHRPIALYRSWFPTRRELGPNATFEATPYYLFPPGTAERIRSTIPNAKLIALLREPVSRALSHYHHNRRHAGREPLDFARAIEAEQNRIAHPALMQHFSYVARGLYAEQLTRYFDAFPREQVLVLFSENFFARPQATYDRVLRFLDLPPHQLLEVEPRHVGTYDRELPTGTESLRARFIEPNRELAALLGETPPWDEPGATIRPGRTAS